MDTDQIRCNNSGTIGSDQSALFLRLESVLDLDHVLLRDTFGYANDQRDFRLEGLQNGCCGAWRGHVDHRSVWIRLGLGLC